MRTCGRGFLLLFLAVGFAGCAHHGATSDQQRSDSFQPFRVANVGDQSLQDFIRRRSALLLSQLNVSTARPSGLTLFTQFEPVSGNSIGCSQALALEHDGYFLTAAHCVGDSTSYLVYSDGTRARIVIPRVVARLKDEKQHQDTAILHVRAELSEVFEWCDDDEIARGTSALAVGRADTRKLGDHLWCVREICFGGRITSVLRHEGGMMTIESGVPMRSGDSGGPLVTTGGKLMGINSYIDYNWLAHPAYGTRRPDRAWIARVIDEDRKASHAYPATIPSIPLHAGERTLIIAMLGDPNIEADMRDVIEPAVTSRP